MTSGAAPILDVLMPLKHGSYVRGDVIEGYLAQGVPFDWYVDAAPDLEIDAGARALLALVSVGPFWCHHMTYMARILAKRNRLRARGRSPVVYLADADVILPPTRVWPGMLAALEGRAALGAVGVIYAVDWPHARYHVGAGSMLLRRSDLEAIGPLRGAPCECTYIRTRLGALGKHVVPLTAVHAHQWKRTILDEGALRDESEGACPLCGAARNPADEDAHAEVRVALGDDGRVPLEVVTEAVARHGSRFKLFVEPAA